MSGPCQPFDKRSSLKKVRDSRMVRKIRVFCRDPDATDLSSSEDESDQIDEKLFVRLIDLPLPVVHPNVIDTECSSLDTISDVKNRHKKRKLSQKGDLISKRRPANLRYKGLGKGNGANGLRRSGTHFTGELEFGWALTILPRRLLRLTRLRGLSLKLQSRPPLMRRRPKPLFRDLSVHEQAYGFRKFGECILTHLPIIPPRLRHVSLKCL